MFTTTDNFVRTATIVDGMGKAVQVHADQSGPTGADNTKFLVSGPQTLDKFGRLTQIYADVFVSGQTFGDLYVEPSYTSNELMQRAVAYDYNSRALSSESWGAESVGAGEWTTTEMQYGWNTDLGGALHYFEKTSVLSSQGAGIPTPDMVAANYTDARGRKIGQITYGLTSADDIITQFQYNEIGELTQVTDPIGAITTYEHDMAGRVTQENHPDRGATTTTYDNASNVIQIETPATQEKNGVITMSYSFNRLMSKHMPNSVGNDLYDIDYIYGYKGDGNNGAGRVVQITQGQTFKIDQLKYDELGQVSQEYVNIDVPMYGGRSFTTQKFYDSFGRIMRANYPDGDQVDYGYTANGELKDITSTVSGVADDIISDITYNGYGQIKELTYGNGTSTTYTYDAGNTKKQSTLMSSTVDGFVSYNPTTLLDRQYQYNKQGMVSSLQRIVNGSLVGAAASATKTYTDAYSYDVFGRFEGHDHSMVGTPSSTYDYTLTMSYNKAGGITAKDGTGLGFQNASALNYNLGYTYDNMNPHQLMEVLDADNSVLSQYQYNSTGSIKHIDDPTAGGPQEFFWNEEQQLVGVSNDQGIHHYIYDYKGERIMKSSVLASKVYVNDETIDEVWNLDPYTVYVNPHYVVTGLSGGDKVSKHYYMNTQRVATDISINYTPPSQQKMEGDAAGSSAPSSLAIDNLNGIIAQLGMDQIEEGGKQSLPSIQAYYPDLDLNQTEFNKTGSTESITSSRIIFWYHPDYLGSVDLITDKNGNAHEFFIYNPWGEQLHQWTASTYAFSSPYRFNGKELDEETGLAYYGARYSNNQMSMWLSVDRLAEKYPHSSPYVFSGNNPVSYVDPNGDSIIVKVWNSITSTFDQYSWEAGQNGDWGFYDDQGTQYQGSDIAVTEVADALNEIMCGGSAGYDLVRDVALDNNKTEVALRFGNRGNATDPNGAKYVLFNPTKNTGGRDVNGSTQRPAYIGLAHELAHVQDIWRGTFDASTWYTTGGKAIPKGEIYASHVENMVRAENNIPLRKFYTWSSSGRLLNNSNDSFYYRQNGINRSGYKKIKGSGYVY